MKPFFRPGTTVHLYGADQRCLCNSKDYDYVASELNYVDCADCLVALDLKLESGQVDVQTFTDSGVTRVLWPDMKSAQCFFCNKRFSTFDERLEHQRETHLREL